MTMAWACLYKDILCSFSMLLAFYFLLRFIDTGAPRYNVYQWTAFILGFGAMETNVVYPAIAIGYTLLRAPRFVRKTLPLAIGSILYLALSYWFVPKAAAGPYRIHIDSAPARDAPQILVRGAEPHVAPGRLLAQPGCSPLS